ncbi:hypothetical protein [Microbacterium enclense]|uniref:hypothetical protein n=1 Tax=Microbacterium enclense TaxID=993073 RepID=UPI003F7CFA3C
MPDLSPSDHPRSTYAVADYRPAISGSGAQKLIDSAVAPLVAVARGYRSSSDKDGLERAARALGIPDASSFARSHERLVASADDDILVMPWFIASGHLRDQSAPEARNLQIRPSTPEIRDGKPSKYLFLKNEQTLVDTHPSLPKSWVDNSPRMLITEGIIKADSALSALLSSVHGPDALRFGGTIGAGHDAIAADRERANSELFRLMEEVPPHQRTVIAAIGGVGNWHNKTEWESLTLRGRTVIVAFDGDVATNPNVRAQAIKLDEFLTRRQAEAQLLDLDGPLARERKAAAGVPELTKLGLDDFLSSLGSWSDLPAMTAPMPEMERSQPKVSKGALRVSETDPNLVEVWTEGDSADRWMPHPNMSGVFVAGRIKEDRVRRIASLSEMSGHINEDLDAEAGVELTLEIRATPAWAPDDTEVYTLKVPSKYADQSPGEWARHGVAIPTALRQAGAWPPYTNREDASRWLVATSTNRKEQTRHLHVWDTVGWVPDGTGGCAFTLGDRQVISRDPENCTAVAGADSTVFTSSERFGVADRFHDRDFATWKHELVEDVRAVCDTYIDDGPWKDHSFGVLSLAAMIRPTVPVRPTTAILAYGSKQSGKSYWTSLVMSGWQRHGGAWTNDFLPGSANDSKPSIEDSMSRTPIWVIDDMAAAISRQKQDAMEQAVADMIRSVHNSTARNRMDVAKGSQKIVEAPRCVLIVTAENELRDTSALDRAILMQFKKGVFRTGTGHSRAVAMRDAEEPAPSRVVAAAIRYWLMGEQSWQDRVAEARQMRRDAASDMAVWVQSVRGDAAPGENERAVNKVSDALLGLYALRSLLQMCGVDETDPLMRKFSWEPGGYYALLGQFAIEGIETANGNGPGKRLLEALQDILTSKHAYISNASVQGGPPVIAAPESGVSEAYAGFANNALGWTFDFQRGWIRPNNGAEIGTAAVTSDGRRVVVLKSRIAFREAKRHTSDLITEGQTGVTTWNDFYAAGLADTTYLRRNPKNGGGHQQLRFSQYQPALNGVIVPLEALVDGLAEVPSDGEIGEFDVEVPS